MRKYDPKIIEQIARKQGITPKSVKEQISRRAFDDNVAPEAELAIWARKLRISANPYINKLPDSIKRQVYSTPNSRNMIVNANPQKFKIVQLGKGENHWYNRWWVQWLGAGLVIGTAAQVFGTIITNFFHITNP